MLTDAETSKAPILLLLLLSWSFASSSFAAPCDEALAQYERERKEGVRVKYRDVKKVESQLSKKGLLPLNADGLPKRFALVAGREAQLLLNSPLDLQVLEVGERQTLSTLAAALDRTLGMYFRDRNQLLRDTELSESREVPSPLTARLIDFVATGRFQHAPWWIDSMFGYAEVTSETSKSFLQAEKRGPFYRRFFWPSAGHSYGTAGLTQPMLDRVRIAVNYDALTHEAFSLEMIAKINDQWEPFYFEKADVFWFPREKVNETPTKQFCARCHSSSSGIISPRPVFLKTESDFQNVGYKLMPLIDQLLEF